MCNSDKEIKGTCKRISTIFNRLEKLVSSEIDTIHHNAIKAINLIKAEFNDNKYCTYSSYKYNNVCVFVHIVGWDNNNITYTIGFNVDFEFDAMCRSIYAGRLLREYIDGKHTNEATDSAESNNEATDSAESNNEATDSAESNNETTDSAESNNETTDSAESNKTPAELKADINNKYGVNAVYYDTDRILCDNKKQNVYVVQHNTPAQTYISAYLDEKELTVSYITPYAPRPPTE